MDNFLTHIFSIKNHPICELKDNFKVQYVMGLGEFMYYMSKKDWRARLVFRVWARSIVDPLPDSYWQSTSDFSRIKKAISLKRDGIKFFTMRRVFFFDCFYLVSKLDVKLLGGAQNFLREQVKGVIAKRILNEVYKDWGKITLDKIPSRLILHRKADEGFHKKPLKKILVVATMSAGKSTLINALVGYRVNEVRSTACTSKLHYLYNKPVADGVMAKYTDGRYVYYCDVETFKQHGVEEAALHFKSALSNNRICFIDTPGTNYSADKSHGEITRKAIASNNYDAIIFIVNSLQFNTDDEASLRQYVIKHSRKPIIFVLNQLDRFDPDDDSIQDTINRLAKIVNVNGARHEIVPLSAYYALLLKIGEKNLTKQEKIQMDRLKCLFQYSYYNLSSYYKGRHRVEHGEGDISKTGIHILENIINKL